MHVCPHCGERWGGHVRADKRRWTPAEREAARAIVREQHPSLQFVDSGYSERTAAAAQARGLG